MPQELIDANRAFRTMIPDPNGPRKKCTEIDRETFEKRIQSRQKYRMTPKGRPDKQGFQRFSYPEPGTYLAIDRATNKPVNARSLSRGSITIPVDAGGERPAVKHLQKFSMGTPEHSAYYGMRSLIESSHSLVKDRKREDLANPHKRPTRGYAFQYLITVLASVSLNIRRIVRFFEATARQQSQHMPKKRAPRRRTESGLPAGAANPTAKAPPR